ncbi:glucose repression mediator protein [Ceratobasidium sp. 370]|nr:glucose repression mediator protein [Ceratobasidium sp. 370]
MASGHPHFHIPASHPPTPAHPPFAAPAVPGTPAANAPTASPSPAMATPLIRSGPAAPPAAAIPHPLSQLPALQKLAQANEQTWLLIGAVAEQMNDLDRALAAYEHAIRHNPHSIAGLTQIAGIARVRENYPTASWPFAVEYFQRVLSLQRENGDVWSALGHCFLMQDDLQNAYSAYQQALYYLPNPKLQDPKLWYGIGILYDRYGSLEHAEEAFSSVLRMDKDFDKADEIFFRLGIIYKQQQKYEESLKCFDRIHRNPPTPLTNIDIWFQIGHVYEQMKDYNAAKEAYERVLKDSPNHAKVLQQLGWLYHQAGASFANQETAIMLITKSLESDPGDAQSWYLLGRAYMAGQKYQKAYESYQQAVYRDGRNPTFWCSIGVLYYNINQFRDALDAYSRAIRINPYISEVWFDLGSLYESCNNQISDAIDAYARAAELDPGNPHITQRLNLLRNVQANGGTLPAAPGPQDIHPTAYAGNGPFNPMHGGNSNVGPPPPLTGGAAGGVGPAPGQSRPPRPDSRGPDGLPGSVRELPALAISAPNGRPGSPPFRAPPPVQLDERSGRGSSNQLAPMDMDRAPPAPSSLLLVHPQSQASANQTQLPPPPTLSGAAGSSFAETERRTRSPSPRGPPPTNSYATRPSQNNFAPPQGYNGYPGSDAAWEREKASREARDRESDRDGRSSRQRQPSAAERVKVEILNQQGSSDRFYPRGGPSSPVTSLPTRYDPRRGSPAPAERPPMEGRSPYPPPPAPGTAPYGAYWDRDRERGGPLKAPSRQHSPAPRDAPAPSNSRRYDPRMDSDQEPPRREYWPEEQGHAQAPHPAEADRYSATPDGPRRGHRGPEPVHGSESPHPTPAGTSRVPGPEPAPKAARRRTTQATREPVLKDKKERKPPAKRGARENSVAPQEREMSAPIPRIAPGPGTGSQQHSTFKVTLGEPGSLPPPPVPSGAANHTRSASGSNGSARSRATPSPTMGPPHRVVDEDYDAGGAVDALIGLSSYQGPSAGKPGSLARPRTASVHSIASPGPHMRDSRHDAFPPPSSTTRSPPVSTAPQRPSPPYRPGSSLPAHPPSPQSVRNGTADRSPPGPFPRRGSSQPRDKTPSLKRGMDDDPQVESKRSRVDVLNPMPNVFPPPPSTDPRSSPNVGVGRGGRFDPVADIRMSESPKEPALPPIATLPPPPDSPRAPSGKGGTGDAGGEDGRSASDRSGAGSRAGSPTHANDA